MKHKYQPTCNGYFSGAGLMEIGLMQAGIKMQQSLDLDRQATATMKMNSKYFSHAIVTGDIKEKTVMDQPESDIAVFTYPCNRYSEIADIHGVRTGDELFLHAFRHIALRQPEMYIIENVPGMRKFKVVMEAMTKLPGYYINVFCPVDAAIWLPQRRERLILFGTKKPFTPSHPESKKRIRFRDIMEKNPKVPMPNYVMNRIKGMYRDMPIVVDPDDKDAIAPTCVAHYAKDMGTRLVKDLNAPYGLRPFSIREYARLQGVPDDFTFKDSGSAYRLIGNGVAVPKGRWVGEQAIKYFNQ